MDTDATHDEVNRLRREVAYHKAQIGKHRDELRIAKTALVRLEAVRHGIGLVINHKRIQSGVGANHGPDEDPRD